MSMEITEWIDECMKEFREDSCTFKDACKKIGTHEKLRTVIINRGWASFEVSTSINKTRISVSNDKLLQKHDPVFVLDHISNISGIPVDSIKMKSRKREITEARFAYCLVNLDFKEDSGLTLTDIGNLVNISHCDVLHSRKVAHIKGIKSIYNQALKSL
jgi:hypothetical protein